MASIAAIPGLGTYSATKIFANYMSQALYWEHKEEIDFLTYCPAEVGTKLIKKDGQSGGGTISIAHASDVAFRDMGISDHSFGALIHEFQAWIFSGIPIKWFYNKKEVRKYIDNLRAE